MIGGAAGAGGGDRFGFLRSTCGKQRGENGAGGERTKTHGFSEA